MKEVFIVLTRFIQIHESDLTEYGEISPECRLTENNNQYFFTQYDAERLIKWHIEFNKKNNYLIKRFYRIEKYLTTE